jgi:hypothetical protein
MTEEENAGEGKERSKTSREKTMQPLISRTEKCMANDSIPETVCQSGKSNSPAPERSGGGADSDRVRFSDPYAFSARPSLRFSSVRIEACSSIPGQGTKAWRTSKK